MVCDWFNDIVLEKFVAQASGDVPCVYSNHAFQYPLTLAVNQNVSVDLSLAAQLTFSTHLTFLNPYLVHARYIDFF